MIQIKDVSFSYNNDLVLNHVSTVIKQGEYVALVGGNGSGKSTLIKLLVGLFEPNSGTINIESHHIAYIPQQGLESITFPVTVEEMLNFRLSRKQRNDQKLTQALKMVGLESYRHRLIKDLSGGQRQRVLIARELLTQPDIIILDEPTNGLDQNSIQSLYQLLNQLHQEGMTVILVTHHLDKQISADVRVLEMDQHDLKELSHV